MKKKQAPILLVVLAIVVVVGLGLTNTTDIWQKLFTPPPKPVTAPDKSQKVDVAGMVNKDINDRKMAQGENGKNQANGMPDKPSIFLAKFKRYNPVPNETSTSSQWYDKEHQQQEREKELEKKDSY